MLGRQTVVCKMPVPEAGRKQGDWQRSTPVGRVWRRAGKPIFARKALLAGRHRLCWMLLGQEGCEVPPRGGCPCLPGGIT